MPATPAQIQFTAKDFEERLSYDDLEAGDYEATCTDVNDIEASTGNTGWGFEFTIKGLPLTMRVWTKGGGKWKVREVFNACGYPIDPTTDVASLDPNVCIGSRVVATVKKEAKNDGSGEFWTNVDRVVPFISDPVADLG